MTRTLRDIGEQGLLKILQKFCPEDIIGDDAAILALDPAFSLVITTDILVDRVHFSDETTSPEDVGWRAVAANLSDLAAMGANPLGITVGLALPPDIAIDWVERLYQGLIDCLQGYNTPIVGGDISRSSVITVSITAFGLVSPDAAIRRGNAKTGDSIVITGYHGLSRAGLALLLHPETGETLDPSAKAILIQAHQRPKPRLDCLPHLREIVKGFSIAGMDSSDGLADAVVQICRCSGVGAEIDRSAIPLHPALCQYTTSMQTLEWVLYGGEDFELVLCLPREVAGEFVNKIGAGAAIIGRIVSGNEVQLKDGDETRILSLETGFQHF